MKKVLLSLAVAATALTAYADGTNLFSNGGFEEWNDGKPANWVTASTAGNVTVSQSEDAHSGSYAVLANATTKNMRLGYVESEYQAGTYALSYYVKSAESEKLTAVCSGFVPVADNKVGSYGYAEAVPDIPTEWTLVTDTFKFQTDTCGCFLIRINKNAGNALIDDASLVLVAAAESGEGGGDDPEPTPDLTGVITVEEAHALTTGTAKVYGTVYAAGTAGFVLGDATGYIYTYYNGHNYAVGDELIIEGAVSQYQGFNQFTNTATITKTASGQSLTYPTPVTLDGATADAWIADPAIKYVSMTGTLTVSGNYYNVTIEGAATAIGSIVYPTAAMKANLTNGATVTVKGFAMYPSGSKYINVVAVEASSAGESNLKSIANTIDNPYSTAEIITLIDDATSDLSDSVYVKGVVSKIDGFNSSYGSITYWLDNNTFEVYSGLGVDGAKFEAQTDLSIGDSVIVKGLVKKYNTTYEFDKNNYIAKYFPTENQVVLTDPTNTPETAYTTAAAIQMIDAGTFDLSKKVYVKGTVSKIQTYSAKNKNLTYWLDEDAFEVYSGYGLQGDSIASEDYLKVGDEVVVYGIIKKYNTTYEFDKGNFLYSVNGSTESSINEVVADADKPKTIYNLLGQRVDAITGKGIYIINGKKTIVR
jgi:hypothetical protein